MSNGDTRLSPSVRRQYLGAMGIQNWYPRKELPGAKPASAVSQEEQALGPVANETPIVVPEAVSDHSLSTKGRKQEKHISVSVNKPQAKEGLVPRFQLLSLIYSNQYMVISDLPGEQAIQSSYSQSKLLSELLNAMGIHVSIEPEIKLFNWPMLQSKHVDQGETVARDAVNAFFNAQTGNKNLRFILVMGKVASQYLLPHESQLTNYRGKLWSIDELPALITHSVDQLLVEPLVKRQVWYDIQPLCRLLEGNDSE